ncbi:MAG: tail fiber domain-containing protein, partial [Pseudomonadota bacterium]
GVGALGSGFALSDIRLKKNIQKLGVYRGANIYSWDWVDAGISDSNIGVIAQEHPEHAFEGVDGYLRVDYGALFNG